MTSEENYRSMWVAADRLAFVLFKENQQLKKQLKQSFEEHCRRDDFIYRNARAFVK